MYFNSIHSNLQKPYRFFFLAQATKYTAREYCNLSSRYVTSFFFYVFTIFSHNNHLLFFDNILVIQ